MVGEGCLYFVILISEISITCCIFVIFFGNQLVRSFKGDISPISNNEKYE